MSLIFISIKKFFQLHPALGEVPTCFKKKKQNLVKNQPKKKFDKEEKKKNMIYNTFVLVQDIPSFGHPSQAGHGEGEDFEIKKRPIVERGSKRMTIKECKSVSV